MISDLDNDLHGFIFRILTAIHRETAVFIEIIREICNHGSGALVFLMYLLFKGRLVVVYFTTFNDDSFLTIGKFSLILFGPVMSIVRVAEGAL